MNCITDSCWGITYYSSRDHFAGTCTEHNFDFGEIEEHPHFARQQSQRQKEPGQKGAEPDFGTRKISELYFGDDRVASAEKKSPTKASPSYISVESANKKSQTGFEESVDEHQGVSFENLPSVDTFKNDALVDEVHREPHSEKMASDGDDINVKDNQGKQLKYEECIEFIRYKSDPAPVTSKFLERFYIPHLLYAKEQEDQEEQQEQQGLGREPSCVMLQQKDTRTETSLLRSHAPPGGQLIRITRKLEA